MSKGTIKKPIIVSREKDIELVERIKIQIEDAKLKPDNDEKETVSLFYEQFGIFTHPDSTETEIVQSVFPFTKGQRDRQALWQHLAKENMSLPYFMSLIARREANVSRKMRETATAVFRKIFTKFVKEA